jgi:PIN domain nuclease of toxin-antitoxin system
MVVGSMSRDLILLDTHIWLWWIFGDAKVGNTGVRLLIHEGEHAHRLCISAISIWEALLLSEAGRIRIDGDLRAWLREAREKFVVATLPVDERVALESRLLPGVFHSDPGDRFIVATARITGASLVTADRRILEYADAGNVRAVDLAGEPHA